METEKNKKTESKVKKCIDDMEMRCSHFAQLAKISKASMHNYYHGASQPRRIAAVKICRASGGRLTLKDFGFK